MAHADSVERFFEFSLLGLVASGYLAVAGSGYLDVPTMALTAGGLVLRGCLICGLLRLEISERTSTFFTIGYAGFYLADYFLLSREFLPATVHLVFFLAVMKILTARTTRDHLYTAVISFLELLAAAILSINFNFFVFLALYLLCAIAALTSGEIRRSMHKSTATARGGLRHFHTRLASLSVFVTTGILLITGGLFFMLPRTAGAALSHWIGHRIHVPGFTNQVTLGEIGEIKTSSRAAMHISVISAEVPRGLKWRGGVLVEFDGKRWSNINPAFQAIPVDNGQADLSLPGGHPYGRGISYNVEYDELETNALFFAGTPEKIMYLHVPRLLRSDGGTYRMTGRPPPQGFHYEGYSLLEEPPEVASPVFPAPILPLERRERYLQLPPIDPRIGGLARAMAAGAGSDLERARAVERHLRTDFGYTLELPSREVSDPLAYFLFVRRKGHCEYFASAMAVMLRTLGIPSRLATGFQSGIYNPISELWLVRASDAHSWVEAWIPGHGWATFDPTPPDPNGGSIGLLTKLSLYVDAADTFWQAWVVGYDSTQRGSLVDQLQQGARRGLRWMDSIGGYETEWSARAAGATRRFGMGFLIAVVLSIAAWLAGPPLFRLLRIRLRVVRARRGQASVADATLLYERMLHIVRRRGFHKPAWFTPAEFAASLPAGELGGAVAEFTAAYNALRFGGQVEVAPRLSVLLKELERHP